MPKLDIRIELTPQLEGLISEAKKMHGFWGSNTGNASMGQLVKFILEDWLLNTENFRKCEKCGGMLIPNSIPHSEWLMNCNHCGYENHEIEE
ncbi:BRcat domain-containing protein [Chondrinema litorale]|uniref:BRcat domain-containing protein n=1 Tax=Chondrinema litorale TaxID=2994555 RepID=UPI002542E3F0|nr:IBR domain-containing protein [Chondrinema litorale]UZS00292.1 IBR domain-containing protein [Chondrinema litorale]